MANFWKFNGSEERTYPAYQLTADPGYVYDFGAGTVPNDGRWVSDTGPATAPPPPVLPGVPATHPTDGDVPAWDSASAQYKPLSLPSTFERLLGASNGTDDTSALNSLLAAGGRWRGKPGTTYIITAPLVLPSSTMLDMTACTVQLKTGSAAGTMLTNAAATAQRTVSDGAMTSGSATLTSATANFTSADIGRTVYVPGACGAAAQLLVANITAVGSATSVTLSRSAGATVSAASVSIFNRDTGISIIGGTWDKQNNDGTGTGRHTTVLRHVDNLTIRGVSFKSTAGKYALSIGDWTNLRVEEVRFPSVQSDGVHLHGPGVSGVVRDIYGHTGDDLVSLTPQDWPAYNDVMGDITDVSIENVYPSAGGVRGVNVIASKATAAKRIRIRNVFGSVAGSAPAVHVGDDPADPGGQCINGAFDTISVENLSTTVPNGIAPVLIDGTAMKRVRVSNVHFDNTYATTVPIVNIAPASAGTLRSVIVENVTAPNIGGQPLVGVGPNATVASLIVDKADIENLSGAGWNAVFVQGTVTDLVVRGIVGNAGNGGILALDGARSSAAVTRVTMTDCHLKGITSSSVIGATAVGHTLPNVEIAACSFNGMANLVDLNTTTELHLAAVTHVSTYAAMNLRASANITLKGDGVSLGLGTNGVKITAGAVVHSKSLGIACDVSQLTKGAGDLATNTNASLSCGAGAVISDGTSWKNLFSGATY